MAVFFEFGLAKLERKFCVYLARVTAAFIYFRMESCKRMIDKEMTWRLIHAVRTSTIRKMTIRKDPMPHQGKGSVR